MVAPQWGQFQKPSDLDETPLQEKEQVQEVKDQPPPQWGQFQSPSTYQGEKSPTEGESWAHYLARQSVSTTSRLLEGGVGKYGEGQALIKSVLTNFPSFGGAASSAMAELVGPENWKEGIESVPNLPTTKEFQAASEKYSGGFTKPKTPGEKAAQQTIQDIASLFSLRRRSLPTWNQSTIVAAANAGKIGTEYLGFSEDVGDKVKSGIWFVGSIIDGVNAKRYASSLMNEARQDFNDPNLRADVVRLNTALDALEQHPNMLPSDPRSAIARQQITLIRQNIANGQTSQQSMLTTYDGINASKDSRQLFDLTDEGDRIFARNAVNRVLNVVRESIVDTGQSRPEALRTWQEGVNAWRVIHESQRLTNWVKDQFKRNPYLATSAAAPLFGIATGGAVANPAVAATLAAGGAGVNKIYETGYRVLNDPVLAEYYFNALGQVGERNWAAFTKWYNKLDKGIDKEEKKKSSKSNADRGATI